MPYLPEEDGHQVYFECSGQLNHDSAPVLFLHGGPGAGCSRQDRELLQNIEQRPVILLDQRGCGQSKFQNRLQGNTTQHLIADIERLRVQLDVTRFVLVGGSWGSTLALSYAIAHPGNVERMILWGIFLCSPDELHWFYQQGANWLFPQEFERFAAPVSDRHNVIEEYHQLVTTGAVAQRAHYASVWARWEAVNSFVEPDEVTLNTFSDPQQSLPMVILETYYFANSAFFKEHDFLLHNLNKITHIPLDIVQGQYDTICPMRSAWLLSANMPGSKLHISPLAAHDASEKQNRQTLKALLGSLN